MGARLMPSPLSQAISDNTQCPHCVEENVRLGGSCEADSDFNFGNDLWAVCSAIRCAGR